MYQISRTGREEAIELSRKFGLDQAAMIEARRLLEERQAAAHATANANIRAAAGYGPGAEAQPDVASEEQPPKLPTANAGNGAAGPAPDVETTRQKMNRWIRSGGRSFV